MDKRSQKTQTAIFEAFFELLNSQSFQEISVGEIIEKANIGRSTFYSHFTSKDDLLEAVCQHLFEHVFLDASYKEYNKHAWDLEKDSLVDRMTHLFHHFKANDEKILTLFKLNDDYFRRSLRHQLDQHLAPAIRETYFAQSTLPDSLITHHIVSCFIACLNWWLHSAPDRTAEEMSHYYLELV